MKLPFQGIPGGHLLKVMPLADVRSEAHFAAHRHDFCMLWWVTAGKGCHRVDFVEHELVEGSVCFMQDGQVHQVLAYPEDGWLVLFSPALLEAYFERNPNDRSLGLFDRYCREPVVRLNEQVAGLYSALLPCLSSGSPCLVSSLSTLLCHTNKLAVSGRLPVLDTVAKLKELINTHYLTERQAPFYADLLGLQTRKLNELAMSITGRMVRELANERLLSQAELLLASGMDLKLVMAELGFLDHSHFSVFFRRHKGMSPIAYVKQIDNEVRTLLL